MAVAAIAEAIKGATVDHVQRSEKETRVGSRPIRRRGYRASHLGPFPSGAAKRRTVNTGPDTEWV